MAQWFGLTHRPWSSTPGDLTGKGQLAGPQGKSDTIHWPACLVLPWNSLLVILFLARQLGPFLGTRSAAPWQAARKVCGWGRKVDGEVRWGQKGGDTGLQRQG